LAKPPPLFPLFGKEGLGEILEFSAAEQPFRATDGSATVRPSDSATVFIRNKFFLNLTIALSHGRTNRNQEMRKL